jgi:hypothetical protein
LGIAGPLSLFLTAKGFQTIEQVYIHLGDMVDHPAQLRDVEFLVDIFVGLDNLP